jgi:predicted peptidase
VYKTKQKFAIWAFLNPNERKELRVGAVAMLKKTAQLGADCRYTEFAAMRKKKGKNGKMGKVNIPGHFAWLWAYAEPDLIPWLFAHKLEKK